ncbi:hypothetical protein MTO96_017880 [Rhipicephalus appendiculatus]
MDQVLRKSQYALRETCVPFLVRLGVGALQLTDDTLKHTLRQVF